MVLLSIPVLVLASVASAQQAGEPTFETVWIPLTETPSPGSPREVKLEGMLYRPPAPGRLPVLVFNHGSTGGGRVAPTSTEWFRYPEVARFFVNRGWAVLIPMLIQGSGTAELQLYPPIGHGEHILLPGAVTVWQTAVESFLAKVGLDQPRN